MHHEAPAHGPAARASLGRGFSSAVALATLAGDYLSMVADLSALRDRYRQVLGSPVCNDGSITVCDLARLRPASLERE
jgi:hypothetical protein